MQRNEPALCHPDRKVWARRMCAQCYQTWYRVKYPERRKGTHYRHHLKKRYGISPATFKAMLEGQDFKCAVCAKDLHLARQVDIDHDHRTGSIRGIICHGCNLLLGLASDDVAVLLRAIAYLERHASHPIPSYQLNLV